MEIYEQIFSQGNFAFSIVSAMVAVAIIALCVAPVNLYFCEFM